MAHPSRNNIYEATIKRMVNKALEKQEKQFEQAHGADTDEQLLAYLRSCADRLHHSPWPREIIGGCFIEVRFGTWKAALSSAKLPMPHTPNQYHSFVRVQEEIELQKIVYRQKKAEKKVRAQKRKEEQANKKRQLA